MTLSAETQGEDMKVPNFPRAFALLGALTVVMVAGRVMMIVAVFGAILAFVLKAVDNQMYDGDQWVIIAVCIIMLFCVVAGVVRPKQR